MVRFFKCWILALDTGLVRVIPQKIPCAVQDRWGQFLSCRAKSPPMAVEWMRSHILSVRMVAVLLSAVQVGWTICRPAWPSSAVSQGTDL